MWLKANLHFHTNDDPKENIPYSIYQGIDWAAHWGFQVIGLTCHQKFVNVPKYCDYARRKGILLIPGIEANIKEKDVWWSGGRHVGILNPDSKIEQVHTFSQLAEYKKSHPEILIIANHPYFFSCLHSLGHFLEKYIDIFDAIELSWFYTKEIDFNRKAKKIAQKFNKPMIATSDTHFLEYMNRSYALLEVENKTVESVINAVKQGKISNRLSPLSSNLELAKIYLRYLVCL